MIPQDAPANFADVGFAKPELLRDTALRYSGSSESSNFSNNLFRGRSVAVFLAARFVHEAEFLSSAIVFGVRNVLKIFKTIVRFITVDVVDVKSFRARSLEGFHDEMVNQYGLLSSSTTQADSRIASPIRTTRQGGLENVSCLSTMAVQCPHTSEIANLVKSKVARYGLPRFPEGIASPIRFLHTEKVSQKEISNAELE